MEPERWRRIDAAVQRAMSAEPARRTEVLRAACGGDRELFEAAAGLLRAEDEAGDFLALPWAISAQEGAGAETGDAEAMPADPGAHGPGERIGPYRLLRPIGRGGMGVVFLAERSDGSFRQRVAIKIVRRDLDPEAIERRFRAERQILAGLAHPNIARLLDGGSTPGGFPYLVMEHVDGLPIDEYCDRRRLDVRARLELFVQVCSAVQHAHRNLVIHRDLKPGNVLVTEDGVPKLLDFGVAKLLGPTGLLDPCDRTVTGERPLTPSYASPEQLTGKPVTTASDTYSLGVVLYLLLVGELPRRFSGVLPADVAEMLKEPNRPSLAVRAGGPTAAAVAERRGVSAGQLVRQLRGDLDNTVLKALRHDPEQRYASVADLGEDLDRHLTGRPVLARPASWSYVSGKFVRRNPIAALASAVAVVLLIAFAATMAVQRDRLARERDRAEAARFDALEEQAKAEQTTALLVGMFDEVVPERALGREVTVREVLDRRAGTLEDELADRPELRATLQATIGRVYRRLGVYPEARELLEAAAETRLAALGPEHPLLAEILSELATVYALEGDPPRAREVLERAVAILRARPPADRSEMVPTLGRLAIARSLTGDVEGAEELNTEILEIQTRRYGAESAAVAHALHNFAIHEVRHGRLEAGRELFERALAIQRKLLPENDPSVLRSHHSLGSLYLDLGLFDRAREHLRTAHQGQQAVLGPDHDEVAESAHSLGDLMRFAGELDEADQYFRRAAGILERTVGPDHWQVADLQHSRGRLALDRGRLEEAEEHFLAAAELRRRTPLGPDHGLLEDLTGLAEARFRAGRTAETRRALDEAAATAAELQRNPWVDGALARVLVARADLDAASGRRRDALTGWRRSLELLETAAGSLEDRRTRAEALGRLTGETGSSDAARAVPASAP